MGVKGVSNMVEIAPRVRASDVEKKLQAALARQAQREGQHIQISVNGSQVALHGRVHSFAEYHAVRNAAWSVPGVTSVQNDLVVQD
jgi:osmotically-inducible protein OsmY